MGTELGDYYSITNYSAKAFDHKKELVTEWTARGALKWYRIKG